MDPEYLQLLMEMLAAQDGGGGQFGDPFAPSGGFPAPPMPNGKMPQYRTQGSGFVSDGTVKDLMSKVLTNQDQFSADAFFDLDPALKPIVARAVSEGGHDPFNVYALADDDAYRRALLDAAIRQEGIDPIQPNLDDVGDVDMDGQTTVRDLSYDQYKQQVDAALGDQRRATDTGMRNMYGDVVERHDLYTDLLNQRLGADQGAFDDFVTQAAPSNERNQNQVDFTFQRLGGMPFPGVGSDSLDFAGTGAAFPAQRGLAQAAAALPAGNDPAMGEFVEQYLRDHGVDIEGNRRRRDAKRREIRSGTARARRNAPKRSSRQQTGIDEQVREAGGVINPGAYTGGSLALHNAIQAAQQTGRSASQGSVRRPRRNPPRR